MSTSSGASGSLRHWGVTRHPQAWALQVTQICPVCVNRLPVSDLHRRAFTHHSSFDLDAAREAGQVWSGCCPKIVSSEKDVTKLLRDFGPCIHLHSFSTTSLRPKTGILGGFMGSPVLASRSSSCDQVNNLTGSIPPRRGLLFYRCWVLHSRCARY